MIKPTNRNLYIAISLLNVGMLACGALLIEQLRDNPAMTASVALAPPAAALKLARPVPE